MVPIVPIRQPAKNAVPIVEHDVPPHKLKKGMIIRYASTRYQVTKEMTRGRMMIKEIPTTKH